MTVVTLTTLILSMAGTMAALFLLRRRRQRKVYGAMKRSLLAGKMLVVNIREARGKLRLMDSDE